MRGEESNKISISSVDDMVCGGVEMVSFRAKAEYSKSHAPPLLCIPTTRYINSKRGTLFPHNISLPSIVCTKSI